MAVATGALQQQHAHRRGSAPTQRSSSRPHVLLTARSAAPAPVRLAPPRHGAALQPRAQAWGQHFSANAPGHDNARLGLLALMKVIAASKVVSQASTGVATSLHTIPTAPTAIAWDRTTGLVAGPAAAACAPTCTCSAALQARGVPQQLSSPYPAAAGDVATAAHHHAAAPSSQPTPDPAAAAALWAEELRHLQARRQHLAAEVADLLALRRQQQQHRHAPTSSVEEALFIDEGAEFCPTTCQVETAPEVRQARQALAQHIAALATRHAWAPAATTAHQHQQPPHAGAKQLQAQWEAAGLDVTHLLVRLAVLQQLPAQPKQRLTARHAKEQVLAFLRDRLAKLAATHPQQQQQQLLPSLPSAAALPPRFVPSQPSQWQVDAPRAYVPADRHYWQ